MSNSNPYKARLARAQQRQPGTLEQVKRKTWGVLCEAYIAIGEGRDEDTRRKAMLAYSQLAMAYAKLFQTAELEARLLALEQADAEKQNHGVV